MTLKDCFQFGKFTKPFRYYGEVILWMDVDETEPYLNIEVVWVEEKKQLVPYMISSLKPHKDRFVAVIEGVDNEEKAKNLCGKSVFLPSSELPELDSDKFYFHEVPGWEVMNLKSGEVIGIVNQVLDHGPYPMLEVNVDDIDVILPLPKNFKIEIDRENQILKVEIPDGLVEVFQNPGKNDEDEDFVFDSE